jgi:CRP-like cAMP-binding protein
MRIELESIRLAHLNLEQVRMSGQLASLKSKNSYKLKTHQFEVLNLMEKNFSIESIIRHFFNKQILLSFRELKDLLTFLVMEELLINDGWREYFLALEPKAAEPVKIGLLEKIKSAFTKEDEEPSQDIKEELKKVPFLRGLQPQVLETMLSEMRVIKSPPGIAICTEGQTQRSLFVMLQGQAAVIKKSGLPAPRKVATITDGAVFGEVGFFLGEPRTADVVTEKTSTVVRLKYQKEVFDRLISQQVARNLQQRFWVIHALMKSKAFSAIPDDCFDALVFAGELKLIPAETFVFKQGDEGDSCYVIVQGNVVVVKDQQNVRVLEQGDSFGEVALLLNKGKRSAGVKSQKETLVLEIPAERFYHLLSQNLALAVEFEKIAIGYLKSDLK